jgi:hypothetical protein
MPALLKEPELRRSIEAYMYALYKGTSMVINAVGRSQGTPVDASVTEGSIGDDLLPRLERQIDQTQIRLARDD